MTYLDRVNSPADVKKMTAEELKGLAADIREGILKRDSLIGGHVGPNLGFVEATLALHYVFNSPEDKIVYDVSHQCYAHKMITGRKTVFSILTIMQRFPAIRIRTKASTTILSSGIRQRRSAWLRGWRKRATLRAKNTM